MLCNVFLYHSVHFSDVLPVSKYRLDDNLSFFLLLCINSFQSLGQSLQECLKDGILLIRGAWVFVAEWHQVELHESSIRLLLFT